MAYVEKLCTKCGHPIWVPKEKEDINRIHSCGGELITMELPHEDYITLCYAWSNDDKIDYTVHWDLYNAMVELRKKDIIEYSIKISQFKAQNAVQKSNQITSDNRNKCPHCHSTNIQSISGLDRYLSVHLWGLASDEIGKSFRCSKCGYTW